MSDEIKGLPLIEAIHAHPAAYWGCNERPFTSLVAFLAGYNMAAMEARLWGPELPELLPAAFSEFVAAQLGHDTSDPGGAWQLLIAQHVDSQKAAFDLFFDLLEKYKRSVQ